MRLVAGVDIGGTKTAAGLVTEDGRLLHRVQVATPAADGPAAVLAAAADAVRSLDRAVLAVGVGSAGVIDPGTGAVRSATDAMPGWPGTELRSGLRELLGVPVAVDNDVHTHAIGEAWQGAAVGRNPVLLVAVGTGVGASLLIDGQVQHGAHAVAGHAGHMAVPAASGVRCSCGATGHAEAVAGGPALLAEYRRRTGDGTVRDLAELSARAEAGERTAGLVLAQGATALGQVVGGLVNMLDPEIVLIGGGVSNCGRSWWDPLHAAFQGELLPPLRGGVPLERAPLGSAAALLGAARLAWWVAER